VAAEAVVAAVSLTYSAAQLDELLTHLGAVEDWLREKCEARHADDMADLVEQACRVLDDLYDEQVRLERGEPVEG
jgi:hypothetical protein